MSDVFCFLCEMRSCHYGQWVMFFCCLCQMRSYHYGQWVMFFVVYVRWGHVIMDSEWCFLLFMSDEVMSLWTVSDVAETSHLEDSSYYTVNQPLQHKTQNKNPTVLREINKKHNAAKVSQRNHTGHYSIIIMTSSYDMIYPYSHNTRTVSYTHNESWMNA